MMSETTVFEKNSAEKFYDHAVKFDKINDDPTNPMTYCKNGHQLSPRNVFMIRNGKNKLCKTCRMIRLLYTERISQ